MISSEVIRGLKLKFCRTVDSISLYKTCVLLPFLMCFRCYGNLKFGIVTRQFSSLCNRVMALDGA